MCFGIHTSGEISAEPSETHCAQVGESFIYIFPLGKEKQQVTC